MPRFVLKPIPTASKQLEALLGHLWPFAGRPTKRSKSKELNPVSEMVVVPVPRLIDRETFDAVQTLLKARHPTVTPSSVISGPTMLTGLIHCAKCGGAMTIRTGKGGRYRYEVPATPDACGER
jgi:hypothetical protein